MSQALTGPRACTTALDAAHAMRHSSFCGKMTEPAEHAAAVTYCLADIVYRFKLVRRQR
jgi:hypothetical protein